MTTATLSIRPLSTLEEFDHCVELQRAIWGFETLELVPVRLFVTAARSGGQVLGAFDGSRLIGFVYAVPGYRAGRGYLHSHMAAVLPQYQSQGIGRQLKLAQREEALARGLDLVEWTFDPLAFRNAHFNFERLGVIVRRYVRNQYGITTSPLHGGLPTDRLVAEWWLRSARVQAVLQDDKPPRGLETARILVPTAIHENKQSNREEAVRLQARVREQFEDLLARGYAVTGFESHAGGGMYVLEPLQGAR